MFDASSLEKLVSAKINHIADPKRYPVENIECIRAINLCEIWESNPYWSQEKDASEEKQIAGHVLFERMLKDDWVTTMIGWAREDGHVNYGQAPTVNHKLIAVMVKLKKTF